MSGLIKRETDFLRWQEDRESWTKTNGECGLKTNKSA
jgi:hypothetical protein